MSLDEDSELVIQPLTLKDINFNVNHNHVPSSPLVVDSKVFSIAMGLNKKPRKMGEKPHLTKLPAEQVRLHWKQAAKKALHMADPWADFHLENLETETCTRYRFNAIRQTWVTDEIQVKLAKEPFSHGAMRYCYRLKKLPKTNGHSCTSASNYVAKNYMQDVNRDIYFQDVKLQMDAKLWGEEYNRHNPPKKVDIFQMSVIEFINRPGKPLFHLEHYIEGNYIKYNSNSGFISSEHLRLTPQAFSHFTFERSGHELIIVDIQGVEDLYTDPQIHTATGLEYGDGNLGTKGMALFFHSHVCNKICKGLGLTPFDLSALERKAHGQMIKLQNSCKTQVRGTEELCVTPTDHDLSHIMDMLRSRSHSVDTVSTPSISPEDTISPVRHHMEQYGSKDSGCRSVSSCSEDMFLDENEEYEDVERMDEDHELQFSFAQDFDIPMHTPKRSTPRRKRYDSESTSMCDENDCVAFQELVAQKSRPSGVAQEVERRQQEQNDNFLTGDSILGQIHLAMVHYYELERFSIDDQALALQESALFHLEKAASCSNKESLLALAKIYLGHNHDILSCYSLPKSSENLEKGFQFTMQAAEAGDRAAMLFVANSYETGENLPSSRAQSWNKSFNWYNKALSMDSDSFGDDFYPNYLILSRLAEMYSKGGYGLAKNTSKAVEYYQDAAEEAMSKMKGRLANKFYQLADEIGTLCEE